MPTPRTILLALAFLSTSVLGSPRADAQGQFAAVTDADIASLKLNHYLTADKKAHPADFEWTFSPSGFILRAGDAPIPPDLRAKLLPAGASASVILGEWSLDKDASHIILKTTHADGEPVKQTARLLLNRTAPTVLRIGDPQHVFEIRR